MKYGFIYMTYIFAVHLSVLILKLFLTGKRGYQDIDSYICYIHFHQFLMESTHDNIFLFYLGIFTSKQMVLYSLFFYQLIIQNKTLDSMKIIMKRSQQKLMEGMLTIGLLVIVKKAPRKIKLFIHERHGQKYCRLRQPLQKFSSL